METAKNINFIQDKPARAAEKGFLPYMEIKSNFDQKTEEGTQFPDKTTLQLKQDKEESYGLSLQLGEDYERKKQQLKEELRQDFRRYVTEKNINAGEQGLQQQALSHYRRARPTTQLQNEIKENSLSFLRENDAVLKIKKMSNFPQTPSRDPLVTATPYHPSFSAKSRKPKISDRPLSSMRDASTETEPLPWMDPMPDQRRWEEMPESWRLRPRRFKELYGTEDETNTDEEELKILSKRRPRHRAEPAHAGRRERRRQHRAQRAAQERREVEAPIANEGAFWDVNRQSPLATLKVNAQTRAQDKTLNKNMNDFATGLLIGATEQEEAAQRRKERYRHELLEQMAEQQRNKRKEKELELRVAATGAIDPEKQPDRIKQFGAVKRQHEERRRNVSYRPRLGLDTLRTDSDMRLQEDEKEPPERPLVAFQSPILEYSAALGHLANTASTGVASYSEDFHKGLSESMGDMVASRVTGFPPPLAPTLSEAYSTPYDDAYYYYGARNPLDPNLTYYGATVPVPVANLPAGAHMHGLQPPAGVFPQMGLEASHERDQQKENVSNYKEALKQQIEETKERKRKEKAERERCDAKLEAEMKAYEPWGRGGAGAPLRDDRGNLISDLKRMHRSNEEAYMNPESRNNRRLTESTGRTGASSRAEASDEAGLIPPPDLTSSFTRPSPHARGNVFSELPTPQQIREQERYKASLIQQIKDKQKMEAEKRERVRLEEEMEEKRLAEERARLQRQYEEEQEKEKRKEMEQNAKNQEAIRLVEERRKEAERKRNEEELKESEMLRLQYEREKQARFEQDCRSYSPPIPTVQKRLGYQNPPRPPSVESPRSAAALSARLMPTPRSPPVPARRNQIRAAEEQQGVISELSVLRRRLKSEQRRLEGQLLQSERDAAQSSPRNRERPLLDVFDMARLRMQVPARRPPSNTKPVNKQNMQDFNQLKYRDSESREEMRRVYPEPPVDEDSLEIQQQALLREQQHRLNYMQRAMVNDYFDVSSPIKHSDQRRENYTEEAERHSLLQSESAFIDPNGYSFLVSAHPERSSARERRRQARRPDFNDGVETPGKAEIRQFLGSASSFHLDKVREQNLRRMKALDDMSEHDWRAGDISAEDNDDLWQQTPSSTPTRRVSTTTVTTEPWLRPGTTETLKKLLVGRRPPSHNEWN